MPLLKKPKPITADTPLSERYERLGPHGLEQNGPHLKDLAFADEPRFVPFLAPEHTQRMPNWAYHLLPEEDGS